MTPYRFNEHDFGITGFAVRRDAFGYRDVNGRFAPTPQSNVARNVIAAMELTQIALVVIPGAIWLGGKIYDAAAPTVSKAANSVALGASDAYHTASGWIGGLLRTRDDATI